ncbi:MAG: hypothetical protein F2793_04030 [Actinobacteria bacterium]|uniref:Unannotated protein n=1 Tax=freshwater metagenome TaxID=449393 RepID=A0A6J7DRP7_9ZZZZ|nr:hypothetical protein [Actinomycetota bacterium]
MDDSSALSNKQIRGLAMASEWTAGLLRAGVPPTVIAAQMLATVDGGAAYLSIDPAAQRKLLRELANELNAPRPMAPDGGPRSEPFTAGCFAACRIGNDGPGLT